MIVLNSLLPVIALLILGRVLKLSGLTSAGFLGTVDKLIYYFFFPLLLFWKIGGTRFTGSIDWFFYAVSLSVLLGMFLLSTFVIIIFKIPRFQAGTFSQSCYRFNTYIGVAVVVNSLGPEGLQIFGLLIGMAIPLINVFAVSTLIWFSSEQMGLVKKIRILIAALVSNPLILGCIVGMLYAKMVGFFPIYIDNSLRLMSSPALPMALISIGGALTLGSVRGKLVPSFLAAALKLFVLPAIALVTYRYCGVDGIFFKVGMIFFALPASTAIYVLSSQLGSDTELASVSIVISTLLSFLSLSFVLLC